jgi:PAS domain S-box-containing protein
MSDITEKSIKRALLEHQLILNAAGEGIYGIDQNGHVTFINQSSIDLLGWSMEDLKGKQLHERHHHTRADGTPYPVEECHIFASLKDGKVHREENEVFWTKDGNSIPVEYISTPIIENGEITGAVVVFNDITERKEAESKISEAFDKINELKLELERERDYLREEVNTSLRFGEFVGNSPALNRMLAQLDAVAVTNTNVLILGESGTGKELVARAVHSKSNRAENPLVKVNCASIPQELFESEFFGHVKGSFTGAHRDRVGRFELANKGSLFLDEVGEVPNELQSKLLRALQEKEFERIGDEKTISVDVRIISATNRDLKAEISSGNFREDLYYRLGVFPIEVPPLRERREDIIPLAIHFLNQHCKELGREPLKLKRTQSTALEKYDWPGNIRELQHIIARSVILSKSNKLILDPSLFNNDKSQFDVNDAEVTSNSFMTAEEFRLLEKKNITAALISSQWKVSGKDGAAEILGIKPTTLAHKIKTLNIKKP